MNEPTSAQQLFTQSQERQKSAKTRQNHTSLNIDAQTTASLDARRRGGETRSSRLAADVTAYHTLLDEGLRRARLTLNQAEASVVLGVFNGTAPGQVWTAERMSMRINDAVALDGVADKWGVNGPALVGTLRVLGDLPCIALVDWAERVWSKGNFDAAEETAIFRGA